MKTAAKKIFVSCVAILSVFVGVTGANASEISDNNANDSLGSDLERVNTGVKLDQPPVILEDRLEEIKNDENLSEEVKQKHIEKIEYLMDIRDSYSSDISAYTETAYKSPYASKYLSVPYYKQERNYYCGPATAQQTYRYNSLSWMSQDEIAEILGVNETNKQCSTQPLLNFLNSNVGTSYEQFWLSVNAVQFDGCTKLICESINNYCTPILWVDVNATWGTGRGDPQNPNIKYWPYTTGGHYLNVSGYRKNGEVMQMTDPYLDWVNGYKGFDGVFEVDNLTVYKVGQVVCV